MVRLRDNVHEGCPIPHAELGAPYHTTQNQTPVPGQLEIGHSSGKLGDSSMEFSSNLSLRALQTMRQQVD